MELLHELEAFLSIPYRQLFFISLSIVALSISFIGSGQIKEGTLLINSHSSSTLKEGLLYLSTKMFLYILAMYCRFPYFTYYFSQVYIYLNL